MPILTVEIVGEMPSSPDLLAAACAAIAGDVLGSAPGGTWVKLRALPAAHYAENGPALAPSEWPVFVSVLQRQPPTGAALQREMRVLTEGLARVLGRPSERVHLEYEPAGAGRLSFGGRFVA